MTLRPWEKWWRVGGVAGITAVVLSLVPLVLGADEPRFTDSGNGIMAWYAHNGDRWLAGIFVLGIACAFFFLPFVSALTSVLANAEGQPAMWSRVAAWGGLLFAAVAVAGLGGEGIVSFLAKDAGQNVARAGVAFAFFLYALAGLFAAVFVLSASLVILHKGIFWPWLGRYGLVVAAVNVIGAAAIFGTPDGPLGVLRTRVAPPALALWIVAAAVAMLRITKAPQMMSLPSGLESEHSTSGPPGEPGWFRPHRSNQGDQDENRRRVRVDVRQHQDDRGRDRRRVP